MKLRLVIIMGIAVRLAIAPFFAHPFDIYAWYIDGQDLVSGKEVIWSFLTPYSYSFFLFIFPATLFFDFLSNFVPSFTLQISSLNPILNPGAPWNITVVPGVVFDLLVKLVLIISDALIAFVLYKLAMKYMGEKYAIIVTALWFLNPLTIWISSGWGMFDTLPTLFTIIALYFMLERKFEFAGVSIALAIAMKYYAAVLIIPVLIHSFQNGGRIRVAKTALYTGISSAVLFLPHLGKILSGFSNTIGNGSPAELHYSGLSLWSSVTLFYSNFNQGLISSLLVVVAISLSYLWVWKNRNAQDATRVIVLAFFLPIACLLLFYRFVGENFFIWILPFIIILSLNDRWGVRGYWILSAIVFISSVTDSLFPYYMLPMAPWMNGFLVHSLSQLAPYRIAPGGNLAATFSVGKVLLSSFGILSFITVLLAVFRFARSLNSIGQVEKSSLLPDAHSQHQS